MGVSGGEAWLECFERLDSLGEVEGQKTSKGIGSEVLCARGGYDGCSRLVAGSETLLLPPLAAGAERAAGAHRGGFAAVSDQGQMRPPGALREAEAAGLYIGGKGFGAVELRRRGWGDF